MPAWPMGQMPMSSGEAGKGVLIGARLPARTYPEGYLLMANLMHAQGWLVLQSRIGTPRLPCRNLSVIA